MSGQLAVPAPPNSIANQSFRLPAYLCILGAGSLAFWRPLTDVFPAKLSDVLFGFGLVSWVVAAGACRAMSDWRRLPTSVKWVVTGLLASLFVATVVGYLRYHFRMTHSGATLFSRILMLTTLFFVLHALIQIDETVRRWTELALLSPVLLLAVATVPVFRGALWEEASARFHGLTDNANTAAAGFVVALGIAAVLALDAFAKRRTSHGFGYSLIAAGALSSIILTQSRAYLFAACVLVLLTALAGRAFYPRARWQVLLIVLLGSAFTVAVTVSIGPPNFRRCIVERLAPHVSPIGGCNGTTTSSARLSVDVVTPQGNPSRTPAFPSKSFVGLARGTIPSRATEPHLWAAGKVAEKLAEHLNFLLGLGLNYERNDVTAPDGARYGLNSIIDIPAYGGIGAVLSIIALLFMLGRRMWSALQASSEEIARPYIVAAGVALCGLWTAAVFIGSPLFNYLFWVLAADVLA